MADFSGSLAAELQEEGLDETDWSEVAQETGQARRRDKGSRSPSCEEISCDLWKTGEEAEQGNDSTTLDKSLTNAKEGAFQGGRSGGGKKKLQLKGLDRVLPPRGFSVTGNTGLDSNGQKQQQSLLASAAGSPSFPAFGNRRNEGVVTSALLSAGAKGKSGRAKSSEEAGRSEEKGGGVSGKLPGGQEKKAGAVALDAVKRQLASFKKPRGRAQDPWNALPVAISAPHVPEEISAAYGDQSSPSLGGKKSSFAKDVSKKKKGEKARSALSGSASARISGIADSLQAKEEEGDEEERSLGQQRGRSKSTKKNRQRGTGSAEEGDVMGIPGRARSAKNKQQAESTEALLVEGILGPPVLSRSRKAGKEGEEEGVAADEEDWNSCPVAMSMPLRAGAFGPSKREKQKMTLLETADSECTVYDPLAHAYSNLAVRSKTAKRSSDSESDLHDASILVKHSQSEKPYSRTRELIRSLPEPLDGPGQASGVSKSPNALRTHLAKTPNASKSPLPRSPNPNAPKSPNAPRSPIPKSPTSQVSQVRYISSFAEHRRRVMEAERKEQQEIALAFPTTQPVDGEVPTVGGALGVLERSKSTSLQWRQAADVYLEELARGKPAPSESGDPGMLAPQDPGMHRRRSIDRSPCGMPAM